MRAPQGTRALATLAMCLTVGCSAAQRPTTPPDPEVVALEGELSNRYVVAGEATDLVARLRVQAESLDGTRRPPINLALVVDTSGSMEGEPIDHARTASLALVDSLAMGDRLSVVAFGSRTEVLLPSTELSPRDLPEVRAAIEAMEASGTTDLAGGLQAGVQQVLGNHRPEGINRVVLLSDGVPNDANSLEALAQAAGERGVSIVALGLGLDYDETLLGRMAQLSGGRFHYIERSDQVATVFRDEVLRLERLVGRGTTLTIQPGPSVSIVGIVGQQAAMSGTTASLSLGDLMEGETRELIVRLRAQGRRSGATVELFDARLSFTDALDGAGQLERSLFLGARSTDDAEELATGRNPDVEAAAERMEAAATTVEAISVARSGELDRARALLDATVARAEARADETGDESHRDRARSMRRLAAALPAVRPAPAGAAAMAEAEEAVPDDADHVVRQLHDDAMDTIMSQ